MDIFEEILPVIRSRDARAFSQTYPGPFLVRQRTEEEIRSGPSRAVGLTFMPGQVQPIDINNIAEDLEDLDAEAELLERYQVYSVTKSNRNIFANGITLGRAQNNDVVVPLASVSKFHAWLRQDKGTWFAYDARSRFGTFVSHVRASPEGDKGLMLTNNQQIKLGEVTLIFFEALALHRWVREQFIKK